MAWTEVLGEGDGSSCSSLSINQANNTRVEVGQMRLWWQDHGNQWHFVPYDGFSGCAMPNPGDPFYGPQCNPAYNAGQEEYFSLLDPGWPVLHDTDLIWLLPNGHRSAKPQHYVWWHGFGGYRQTADPHEVKAVFVQVYARLMVEDDKLPDDRHLARYVMHVASDCKQSNGITCPSGDLGMSMFKRVTTDWQPYNMLTNMTWDELSQNPPPFTSQP